ncbi:hypothetical protein EW145_g8461 [Phellinidium pouzarii]|uniref:Uncharacterized protein n=1 Tax=Phellinidium pouzarii TaxID=167371 RepID=A0A4S4KA88_9AGAM|nr:hypothetical protein EW145_g8461 [Phellinidium pouzarii]
MGRGRGVRSGSRPRRAICRLPAGSGRELVVKGGVGGAADAHVDAAGGGGGGWRERGGRPGCGGHAELGAVAVAVAVAVGGVGGERIYCDCAAGGARGGVSRRSTLKGVK